MKTSVTKQDDVDYLGMGGCTITYGHFSMVHAGHIRYLRHAKNLGKRLIVAIAGDKKKYAFNQGDRAEGVALLGIADEIVLLNEHGLEDFLKKAKPSTFVLGNEYKRNSEMSSITQWLDEKGIRVEYHAGETQNIAVELLEDAESRMRDRKNVWAREFCSQRAITTESLAQEVAKWSKMRMLVVGDLIIDEYVACEALGMSAEAPVIVVREQKSRKFIGGAGVVAAHIRALGAKCRFISVAGEDDIGDFAEEELLSMGVDTRLIRDNRRPTTYKKRYVADNQKLLRVSRLEDNEICDAIENEIISALLKSGGQIDGLVVSDFVYGMVTEKIIDTVRHIAEMHNIPVFADTQCSTQVGSICKYRGFTVLTPNEREARLALQDQNSGVEQLAMDLIQETRCKQLVMKLGSEGFISYQKSIQGEEISRISYPALSSNPIDVAGAGDSLLAVIAIGISANAKTEDLGILASCMSAIAVERMGNSPIRRSELIERLERLLEE
jgi:rfaE bifunctional protein kinase chain/domain